LCPLSNLFETQLLCELTCPRQTSAFTVQASSYPFLPYRSSHWHPNWLQDAFYPSLSVHPPTVLNMSDAHYVIDRRQIPLFGVSQSFHPAQQLSFIQSTCFCLHEDFWAFVVPICCETGILAAFDPASKRFLGCHGHPMLSLPSSMCLRSTLQGHQRIGLMSAWRDCDHMVEWLTDYELYLRTSETCSCS